QLVEQLVVPRRRDAEHLGDRLLLRAGGAPCPALEGEDAHIPLRQRRHPPLPSTVASRLPGRGPVSLYHFPDRLRTGRRIRGGLPRGGLPGRARCTDY